MGVQQLLRVDFVNSVDLFMFRSLLQSVKELISNHIEDVTYHPFLIWLRIYIMVIDKK
jgi:hypothetical protein